MSEVLLYAVACGSSVTVAGDVKGHTRNLEADLFEKLPRPVDVPQEDDMKQL